MCARRQSRNRYLEEFGANRVTIVSIPNAGHALLPEQPAAVAEALVRYMEQLQARS